MIGSVFTIKQNHYGSPSFGFITGNDGKEYYFNKRSLINCNIYQLEEGDVVEFEITTDEQNRIQASSVRKKYQAEATASITNPGINPNVNLSVFNDDEKQIIQFLKTVFYVSNGGREFTIGESTYRYCLIKPTEYFNHTFFLNREIVVIFCDYVCFEPRSLDAADRVYERIESKLRLDRGCHIFVCHDDTVEAKLSSVLKDSNVNQIVIPFTYRELLSKSANKELIQERFRKYLFDTDLFSVSAPIQNDVFFFGRRDYVHDIVSKCKNCAHSGVFGLRRSGKTSLLYAVQRLLEQQNYPTVFIPCEGLSTLNWQIALCKVVLDIYKAFNLDASGICEEDYKKEQTTIYFEEDLNYCLEKCNVPLTLMFDEIEAITFGITQGEQSDDIWVDGTNFINFWNAIKAYYSKHPNRICVLVAGTNPMINEVPTIGSSKTPNPMFRQLSESNQGAYLQAFSTDDTKNMVNTLGGYMGITFDDHTIGRLTSDCGGHPYLTRILCSHINKYVKKSIQKRPIVITKAIYDKALPDFEKSNEAIGFFWMILNILMISYPTEFATLKVLALDGDAIISQIQDQEALQHLIGYGLIDHNSNRYAIKYDTILRFLRGEYKFERQGLDLEEQKLEIWLRVNSAEIKLRKIVRNNLKNFLGIEKAKCRVLLAMENYPAISERDLRNAESLDYNKLFDPSINKMYIGLMKNIISENITLFENTFEGETAETIRNNLDVINSARICADHAFTEESENWSYDRFKGFRVSMTWLERILSEYE